MKKVRFDIRTCPDCGVDISSRGPRATRCVACQLRHRRQRDKERKSSETYREYKADYDRRNAKKYHERYLLNRDRLMALHKAWRVSHPHKEAEYIKKRRAAHPEFKERERAWAASNPDKYRAYRKKWISNPENYQRKLILNARRRAIQKGAPVIDFSGQDWAALLQEYHYRCAYCGELGKRLTKDHVIPLSRGGDHTRGNIVPACASCNSKKGNRLIEASC